ncbi:MAG: hypothetical protein KDD16_13120 [Mangrovimonas sp.]|nr:hypothetical protein [Mangrovimonas sp.]
MKSQIRHWVLLGILQSEMFNLNLANKEKALPKNIGKAQSKTFRSIKDIPGELLPSIARFRLALML